MSNSAGNVTMTLEAYNKMRDRLQVLEAAVTVKMNYGRPQVQVNLEPFRKKLLGWLENVNKEELWKIDDEREIEISDNYVFDEIKEQAKE